MTPASSPLNGRGEVEAPVPSLSGSFAIFDKPDGGAHVAVRFAGDEDREHHRDIPPMIVSMARRVLGKLGDGGQG